MFPDDQTLIARGKYSTLNREWHDQVKRVQDICRTVQGLLPLLLTDCQEKPPVNPSLIQTIERCMENVKAARERLQIVSIEMAELEPQAWPK